jgi:hypothetical protein
VFRGTLFVGRVDGLADSEDARHALACQRVVGPRWSPYGPQSGVLRPQANRAVSSVALERPRLIPQMLLFDFGPEADRWVLC